MGKTGGIKVTAGILAFVFFMMGGLTTFLSVTPPHELSEELRLMQQSLGFGLVGGFGWFKPCEYIKITSPFGWRVHPITGEKNSFHNGVDLANDYGTPIYAAKSGTVTQVSGKGGYGNHVRITHENEFITLYAHMQSYVVQVGDQVSGGQLIGYMGSTGNSTGPHLHFSVFDGSDYVDPMLYISDEALSQGGDERQVYDYLTIRMGLNSAAACGVLANMEKESNFDPHALGDHGTSYGLCQWHDSRPGVGRWTNLKNFCQSHGLDYTTMTGQLEFLMYELQRSYPGLLNRLKNVPNSASGAYDAAYWWCILFEVPADKEQKGKIRGETAVTVYWTKYR